MGATATADSADALIALHETLADGYLDLSQHGDRVGHYCAITACELGMGYGDVERMGLAGACTTSARRASTTRSCSIRAHRRRSSGTRSSAIRRRGTSC